MFRSVVLWKGMSGATLEGWPQIWLHQELMRMISSRIRFTSIPVYVFVLCLTHKYHYRHAEHPSRRSSHGAVHCLSVSISLNHLKVRLSSLNKSCWPIIMFMPLLHSILRCFDLNSLPWISHPDFFLCDDSILLLVLPHHLLHLHPTCQCIKNFRVSDSQWIVSCQRIIMLDVICMNIR